MIADKRSAAHCDYNRPTRSRWIALALLSSNMFLELLHCLAGRIVKDDEIVGICFACDLGCCEEPRRPIALVLCRVHGREGFSYPKGIEGIGTSKAHLRNYTFLHERCEVLKLRAKELAVTHSQEYAPDDRLEAFTRL